MADRRGMPRRSLKGDSISIQKACPIVLRDCGGGSQQILAFEHPQAGYQLVKGTIEAGESPAEAALRELAEESGIKNAIISKSLGQIDVGQPSQTWHLYICEVQSLADSWTFYSPDDGGHAFRFFWHNVDESAGEKWHQIFRQVLKEIRVRLDY